MRKALLLFLLLWGGIAGTYVIAQEKSITGKVVADDGSALPGVNIIIKGTTRGTNTDAEGNFKINVPANARLLFSYVGFTGQEIIVGNQTTLNVKLLPDASNLEEVVVTTFGTAKKTSFTGSAAKIDAEKLGPRPITNVGQALAGSSAGVQATAGSGQPGAAPDIRIRGFGSISSSNSPLYVVDGIPYSADIANISTDDIETITILKDAASTALYGARAANGVVMITTKKGQKGQNTINVKYTKGFSTRALPEYDRVGPADYYPLMWEANRNNFAYRATNPIPMATASANASSGLGAVVGYNVYNVPFAQLVGTDGKLNPSASMIYSADDLNWEKPLMRQGNRDEISLNFSGSGTTSDYFLSLSYLSDKGFLIRSDYERYTARLSVNNQMKPWFKTGANLAATITKSNLADADGNTSFVNPFFFSRGMAPIYPIYAFDPANPSSFLTLENGNRRWDYGNLSALGLPNRPQYGGRHSISETLLNQNYFRRNVLGGRAYAELSFLKNFKFTTNVGADITNRNNVTFGNPEIGDGAPAGRATHEFENVTSYNLSQLLNYTKTFGSHGIEALVGHENYNATDNNLTGSRSQQILDGNYELVNFTTTTNLNSQYNIRRVEGFFSRVNYDYNQKYFLSVSARRDGSSKFYKDVRWGTFYSVSGAWRLDQEDFIKAIPALSMLKLRGSYGQTGNDGGISNYAWQPLYALGWNNATEAGILQSSLGNTQLEWESSNAFDVALEFGLLKNRISGTIEYFDRRSSNLIFDVPLPLSSGITTVTRNIGTMYNKGIEVELSLVPFRSKEFSWTIDLNATSLKNQITKMPTESPEIIDGTKKLKEGKSLYDFWLREYMGVNSTTGEALYRAVSFQAANSSITEKGDTVTTNVNNARFGYFGTSIPKLTGGFTNTIRYKGFSLSALVVYQIGGKIYDDAYASLMGSGYHNAKHVDILKRWQNPGDVTDVPRMDAGRTVDFNAASSRWLIDASYLNIRSVTLSYTIPKLFAQKLYIQNAQVYVSGENFFIKSRRSGMNVQQNFGGTTSNVYSTAKSLVMGISFSI
ncbi:SusC/RagA family TonB-linked outer membrane protein [Runella sp. CRIBMP]|uniref:SusC/RagA family TonB-linked outer membrane protein n=1 Tax=Runella sp. CRIBMP TaxID=2683261 RepID=UPI00141226F1|nr:TonB-dependent receptor [Runella sp. CRIBMP]NBB18644.1 SusC/RagA family TonB-linked outer membrane protein [Runella sp. CRIBMP]